MIGKYLRLLLDWSEVWALLMPLSVLLLQPKQPANLKSIILYLWVALFLNSFGNIIADFKEWLPTWLHSNNPLYNLHSIIRFTCFAAFFMALRQPYFQSIRQILPILSLVFLLVNFGIFEDFFYRESLSGNLLSLEAYLLLVYCLVYYLSQLRSEEDILASEPDFWVTTGLCIYVVINFFVFLFYVPMIKQDWRLANSMWDVHNVAYILLCLFIAKAFYVPIASRYKS